MNKELLKERLNEVMINYSDEAVDAVTNIIDELDNYNEVYEAVTDEVDSALMYYSEAFEYLKNQSITDFKEAIDEWGANTITMIAAYYLNEEVLELLNSIDLDY